VSPRSTVRRASPRLLHRDAMPSRVKGTRRPTADAVADSNEQGSVPASSASGSDPLSERLGILPTLSLGDLRLEWRRLYRADAPRLSRDIMMRAIAYRLQEIAYGGLSKATQRRLATLASGFEAYGTIAPAPVPRIKPGSRLVREWHGRTNTVNVTDSGFEFEGKSYPSLTKIACVITGAQWSGPRFFGLAKAAPVGMPAANLVMRTNEESALG
jgi:Protein of unknown function (DUF2924)